jgi:hypothetical protein
MEVRCVSTVRGLRKSSFAIRALVSDPLPTKLVLDLRGISVDPERLRWFDLESVKEEQGKGGTAGLEVRRPR